MPERDGARARPGVEAVADGEVIQEGSFGLQSASGLALARLPDRLDIVKRRRILEDRGEAGWLGVGSVGFEVRREFIASAGKRLGPPGDPHPVGLQPAGRIACVVIHRA